MKTLIIFGSPRAYGETATLVRYLASKLEGEYLLVRAYDKNISACVDCRYCRDHEGCKIIDGMQKVYDFLPDCDNILLASPIHFSELSARLLLVCSRLQTYYSAKAFRGENMLYKKKKGAVILTGGGEGGSDTAMNTAIRLLHFMNAWRIHSVVTSFHTDKIPASKDAAAIAGVDSIVDFFNRAN